MVADSSAATEEEEEEEEDLGLDSMTAKVPT